MKKSLYHLVLEALPQEYGAFCLAIRTKNDVFTLEKLNTLLNAKKRAIKKKFESRDTSIAIDDAKNQQLSSSMQQMDDAMNGVVFVVVRPARMNWMEE